MKRESVDRDRFNPNAELPFELRPGNFEGAMQDVYDFFHEVNELLLGKGLHRLDDMLRPAAMSGLISDMLTASIAKQSRTLVENTYFNGHPDLLVRGKYANNSAKSGEHGLEIKTTVKRGGAVDLHGARSQHMCVFVYETDHETEPSSARRPMRFTQVFLAEVLEADFRLNPRSQGGTPTATLHGKGGLKKLREGWIYLADSQF